MILFKHKGDSVMKTLQKCCLLTAVTVFAVFLKVKKNNVKLQIVVWSNVDIGSNISLELYDNR